MGIQVARSAGVAEGLLEFVEIKMCRKFFFVEVGKMAECHASPGDFILLLFVIKLKRFCYVLFCSSF